MVLRAAAAVALAGLLLAFLPVGAAQVSPSEILADPDKYDGQSVTLTGTVTNLRETVSRRGNPYFTFDLSDGKTAIRVFSFGKSPCHDKATATVEGRFDKVKRTGRYTFYNEVEGARVACK